MESYLARFWNIIDYLRTLNNRCHPVQIIIEGHTADKAFKTLYMVRDRTESVMHYDEFLSFIYKDSLTQLKGDN